MDNARQNRRVAKRDLKRVERAARQVDKARDELRAAIVLAREAGETFEDIGRAAGLSRQRAQQILTERKGAR
jgi:DNA-directed RNA polymerase sigma subunit (sigma70/sigma32)